MTQRLVLLTLALMPALSGCHNATEPDLELDDECTLQLALIPQEIEVLVGVSASFTAASLPLLPPGHSCGPADVTWSLSDSSRASLTVTSSSRAVVTANSAGIVTLTAHGKAGDHETDESARITIIAF